MPKKLLVIWDKIHVHFTPILFWLWDDSLIFQAPKQSLANGFKEKKFIAVGKKKGVQLIFHKKLYNWCYTKKAMFIIYPAHTIHGIFQDTITRV
jgi:hypothetical protein